jgi:hypothetical protein
MQQLLVGNPALGSLFENVLAARPTSESLDRHAIGRFSDELPRIVDRPNVQQAPRTDGPVISGALAAKTDRAPVAASPSRPEARTAKSWACLLAWAESCSARAGGKPLGRLDRRLNYRLSC